MRVIAGALRGRRLKSLPDLTIRPTLDRIRESIFNILQREIPGARVLDLYAGTGALGIEALSRGAALAVFLDDDPRARRVLQENLTSLDLLPRASVRGGRLPELLTTPLSVGGPFDIIFADPPYRSSLARETFARLTASPWFPGWRRLVIETERGSDLSPEAPGTLEIDRRVYGDTAVLIARPARGGHGAAPEERSQNGAPDDGAS